MSKFNTAVSSVCSLGSLEPEDVLHLFCHGPKTQNLWESLRERPLALNFHSRNSLRHYLFQETGTIKTPIILYQII